MHLRVEQIDVVEHKTGEHRRTLLATEFAIETEHPRQQGGKHNHSVVDNGDSRGGERSNLRTHTEYEQEVEDVRAYDITERQLRILLRSRCKRSRQLGHRSATGDEGNRDEGVVHTPRLGDSHRIVEEDVTCKNKKCKTRNNLTKPKISLPTP